MGAKVFLPAVNPDGAYCKSVALPSYFLFSASAGTTTVLHRPAIRQASMETANAGESLGSLVLPMACAFLCEGDMEHIIFL